ncbi:MAG: flagellar M-ring protein FliF [Spirochaetales bacterium]|nr:flagellar M-ring protein FliF [Spirochaetales bacterium]
MNEWFKKVFDRVKTLWGKWSLVQKIIFFAIIGAAVAGLIFVATFSSTPNMVPLMSSPITDPETLSKISYRLDQENVEHRITEDNRVMVNDKLTSQRMIALLAREDLIPTGTSPWDVFKMDRWTVTDFEREINLRQAIAKNLKQHIEALDDVDNAQVTLVMPDKELFSEDQDPVTASVIISPRPGSDIITSRSKIEGIVRLVMFATQGLLEENIVITDQRGNVLNDFEGLEDFDRLELTKRQIGQKDDLETQYKNEILTELRAIFGADRVKILKVEIDLDMGSKMVETDEFFPITTVQDNPATPFDETKFIPNVMRSQQVTDEQFRGTGYNPEGPPGQEGQTPPAYEDLSGLVGEYSNNSNTTNYEINERRIVEEKSPWEINKITIGVAIDGLWKRIYNDRGSLDIDKDGSIIREYTPVTDEDLGKAKTLIEHAIGYDSIRGDSVTVQHLTFDRTSQFEVEDQVYRDKRRTQQMVLYSIIGLLGLGVVFIVFRLISREMERRRRLREEELARQHQAMREAALRSAEEENIDVNISVEEKARQEMQEHARSLAREHPEDVAQLIRTWLVEE